MAIVVADAWSSASPVPRAQLIERVLGAEGLQGSSYAENKALAAIDNTINDLNTRLFNFNRIDASGLTFTANSAEIDLPTTFYKPLTCKYTHNTTNKDSAPLDFIDWYTYEAQYGETRHDVGTPCLYTVRNTHTEGKLYLAPRPSADFANNHTLDLTYFRRIPHLSDTNQLNIPAEVEPVIVYGAQKRIALELHGGDSAAWQAFEMEYIKAWDRLEEIDKRYEGKLTRMRLYNWTSPVRHRNTVWRYL